MRDLPTKNRGAISNPAGRFEKTTMSYFDDGWDLLEDDKPLLETLFFPEYSKTIISRNDSPDLGFEQTINPYRGCEHGCVYCYARPSHAYMDLSPGLDFETKIFYKMDAQKRLLEEVNKPRYQCKPIVLGANTDPYQPIEAKLRITRSLIETLNDQSHPVSIITKNSLIERDIDLLKPMAEKNLIQVALSITTLSKSLKRLMEPRTSIPSARLKTAQLLVENGIPVRVMFAPVIPFINDMELEKLLKATSEVGVKHVSYILIRLPHEVKDIFKEWLWKHFPLKAERVMSHIREMRGGKEYDATFGKRMRGEGLYADLLKKRFQIACHRYALNIKPSPVLETNLFIKKKNPHQLTFNFE